MPVKDYKQSISVHNANIDPDIVLADIECPIQQELLQCFDSVVYHDSEMGETAIHYYTKEMFFTFDEMPVWIYADFEKVNESEYNGTDDMAVECPLLRCVYVLDEYRKQGFQQKLLSELTRIAEATKRPFAAFASPFNINVTSARADRLAKNGVYVTYPYHSGLQACTAMEVNGYRDTKEYQQDYIKQASRFRNAGLDNIKIESAVITVPEQHFIYVPDSLNADQKRTLESNRIE